MNPYLKSMNKGGKKMVSMQAFYTSLFSTSENQGVFSGLLRIARASLKEILAVRSEMGWDEWTAPQQ